MPLREFVMELFFGCVWVLMGAWLLHGGFPNDVPSVIGMLMILVGSALLVAAIELVVSSIQRAPQRSTQTSPNQGAVSLTRPAIHHESIRSLESTQQRRITYDA